MADGGFNVVLFIASKVYLAIVFAQFTRELHSFDVASFKVFTVLVGLLVGEILRE